MTYDRFEDLPVWQAAAELYVVTETLLEDPELRASRGWRDQFDRAALSVSNNIAEGFERGTTNELLAFIYIARGSAGEVRSMLGVLEKRRPQPAVQPLITRLKSLAESCSRQLRGWADSLQNSNIKGQRHLDARTRQDQEDQRRAEDFQRRALGLLPPDHPLRRMAEEKKRHRGKEI